MLNLFRKRSALDVMDAIEQTQGVIEFDLDGKIIRANQKFLDLLGYSLDEARGRHHSIFATPDYARSPEYRSFWQDLRAGRPQTGEFKRLSKSGEPVWIQATYTPIIRGGRVQRIIKFATDVTAQVIEGARIRAQMEAINRSQAVIEFGPDGTILEANENFLNLMGYSLAEIRGKKHQIFVRESERTSRSYAEFWNKLRAGNFETAEYERITKSGRPVWIHATYNPICSSDGEVVRVIKFANDITAEVLRNQEFKLLSLVANETDNSIVITNKDGFIQYVNQGFTKLTGYSLDEVVGKKPGHFLQGPATDMETVAQIRDDLRNNRPSPTAHREAETAKAHRG